ncbi:hypothetical protein [Micromonospora sp. NPDC048063]|uniref:hypothetical protein n=1 Tax=Micromonospora sp. NPDC048063 TaxID=3364256 RepID=UPI00371A55C8
MDSAERLVRLRRLLAGLPGPYGNGRLWTLVRSSDAEDPFPAAFAFLTEAAVIGSGSPYGTASQAPQDAAELSARMGEVDQDAASAVLVGMTARTLAYRTRGRYPIGQARDVFQKTISLLGHGTHWWTNTDLEAWNPVSRHVMDALVIAAGGGVLVAVLAADED